MNWYIVDYASDLGIDAYIQSCKDMAADVIESWIARPVEETEVQPEGWLHEKPDPLIAGPFYWEGISYRFRTTMSYGGYKLGRIPYNIKIERTDPDSYAVESPMAPKFDARPRIRYIDEVPPIA
jgi:hypothetical protein